MARRVVKTGSTASADRTEAVPPVAEQETRQAAGDQDRTILKLEDVVWFLVAVIESLIVVRFFLLLFGAQTGVPFVDFWYNISAPLIGPFAGMFGSIDTFNTYTGSRLELEALVAMLIYGLLGYLLVLAIRLWRKN